MRRKTSHFRRLMQIGTFVRKETAEVLSQPRLLLTLVIGPFIILLAFGIGYNETPDPMRTLFVAPEGSPFLEQIDAYADDLGSAVDYRGTSTDFADAKRRLTNDEVDLVVAFPDEPLETILGGDQATITILHTRLDPIELTAIHFASKLAVEEINGEILGRIIAEGQAALIDQTAMLGATVESLRVVVGSLTASDNGGLTEAQIADLTAGLETLDTIFERVALADPNVLARPFESDVESAVPGEGKVTDWYAPAAVVLLLQQFGVAFGSLTFVRERQLGIIDVFRVAPMGAKEVLLGKYIGYMFLGGGVAALLTGLVVVGLDVPVQSDTLPITSVIALLLFASIGLGFVISLSSANDTQAVQYTMLVLLASLFFSGFFLSLGQLQGAAQVLSYLLPVTYGMSLLRDVMLRGDNLDQTMTLGLAGFGVAMFALALVGTRRRMTGAT